MILLVHMLLGSLIGQKIANPFLAIILAFLSHYMLDFIPHIEYKIKKVSVILDFICGIVLIFLFSKNTFFIYLCAFFAILPDGFSVLNWFVKNKILNKHSKLHQEKLHFLRDKKISIFWRIFSQIFVVFLCLFAFLFFPF